MSWPRFTYVVELNVDSVRNTDPQRLGVIDIRPHYVSTASNYSWHFYQLLRTHRVTKKFIFSRVTYDNVHLFHA